MLTSVWPENDLSRKPNNKHHQYDSPDTHICPACAWHLRLAGLLNDANIQFRIRPWIALNTGFSNVYRYLKPHVLQLVIKELLCCCAKFRGVKASENQRDILTIVLHIKLRYSIIIGSQHFANLVLNLLCGQDHDCQTNKRCKSQHTPITPQIVLSG